MFLPLLPADLEPITEANIRTRLVTALGSELGEYELGLPAIYLVRNPESDPPKNYRTTGIECLVFRPDPQSPTPLHHNAALPEIWDIRLLQRDRSGSLLAAYQAILNYFPDCLLNSHIQANRDIDEQLNLSLSQVEIIR
jgi:hypothetical protein